MYACVDIFSSIELCQDRGLFGLLSRLSAAEGYLTCAPCTLVLWNIALVLEGYIFDPLPKIWAEWRWRGRGGGVPPGSFIVTLHLTFNYNNFSFKLTHRFNVSFWKQINRPTRELNPRCCHQRRRFYIWTLASTATNNEFSCHTNTTVSAARFTGVTLSFVVGYSNHLTALPLFRKHVLSATPINSQRQFR